MKKLIMNLLIMNLQLFAGHSVTVYKDSNMSAASASPSSNVEADTEVTLTLTPASGYEVDQIVVLGGGVTVNKATKKFAMGDANVVLAVTSKANNLYKIVENCDVTINGAKTSLIRNMTLVAGPSGAVIGVDCTGTTITLAAEVVASLVKSGAIVKI